MEWVYPIPAREFRLSRLELPAGRARRLAGRGPDCLLVLEGAAVLECGGRRLELARGGAALVPAGLPCRRARGGRRQGRAVPGQRAVALQGAGAGYRRRRAGSGGRLPFNSVMLLQAPGHLGALCLGQEEPVSHTLAETDLRPQNLRKPEAPRLAMVSRSLLLREALARRLSRLGVGIAAVSDFETLVREIESERPALVLVDGDGWEQRWDALIRGLELKKRGVSALLLIASLSVDQVLEAPSLGIGTVILKPFKPEEHTARIYDLLLGARALTARRAHPRYVPTNGQGLEMEILPEGDWVTLRLPVLDICDGGARIELPELPAAARLVPGSRGAVA